MQYFRNNKQMDTHFVMMTVERLKCERNGMTLKIERKEREREKEKRKERVNSENRDGHVN